LKDLIFFNGKGLLNFVWHKLINLSSSCYEYH
jgi:hypothetical protein